MKRVVALVAVLICCTSSAFAWSAESFVNGSVYEYEPVVDQPMLMSLAPAAVDDSFTASLSIWDFCQNFPSVNYGVLSVSDVDVPSVGSYEVYSASYMTSGVVQSTGIVPEGMSLSRQAMGDITISEYDSRYATFKRVEGFCCGPVSIWGSDGSQLFTPGYFDYSLDLTLLGTFYAFEFPGQMAIRYSYAGSLVNPNSAGPRQLDVFCDGSLIQTLLPYKTSNGFTYFDLSSISYSSSKAISDITLRFWGSDPVTLSGSPGSTYGIRAIYSFTQESTSDAFLVVLRDYPYIDDVNAETQDKINDHEAIESEWTGSMTENFNALDLSGFTFPDGLVAAFALITGIFNDLWNGMGDYKILYVFPLTLGVVLLLIGRISKFSGRGSSGRGGKGDAGA